MDRPEQRMKKYEESLRHQLESPEEHDRRVHISGDLMGSKHLLTRFMSDKRYTGKKLDFTEQRLLCYSKHSVRWKCYTNPSQEEFSTRRDQNIRQCDSFVHVLSAEQDLSSADFQESVSKLPEIALRVHEVQQLPYLFVICNSDGEDVSAIEGVLADAGHTFHSICLTDRPSVDLVFQELFYISLAIKAATGEIPSQRKTDKCSMF